MLLLLITGVVAKFISLNYNINSVLGNVQYLTKFGVDLGTGSFAFRVKLNKPYLHNSNELFVRYHIFTDDYWPVQKKEEKCINKRSLSTYQERVTIPLNGEWSEIKHKTINLHYRDKIYIIATSDCDLELQKLDGYSIEVEITALNNDSHFSCEDNYLQKLYGIQIICTILIGLYAIKKGNDDKFITYMLRILLIDFIAEVSLFLHFTIYSFNGKGIYFFDLIGNVSNNASQLLFSLLFIALSQGWTITKQELFHNTSFTPFVTLVVIYQSIIMLVIKYFDGSEDKYHNFYGIGGWLLMMSKFGLTMLYGLGIKNLFKEVKERQFIFLVGIIGLAYQAHYPIVVFISEIFIVPYWRNRVIVMTTILLQHLSMLFCTYICTSKNTTYFQLKNKSQIII